MDSKENKIILTDEELDNATGGMGIRKPPKSDIILNPEALNISTNKDASLRAGIAKNVGLSATSTGGSGLSANINKI